MSSREKRSVWFGNTSDTPAAEEGLETRLNPVPAGDMMSSRPASQTPEITAKELESATEKFLTLSIPNLDGGELVKLFNPLLPKGVDVYVNEKYAVVYWPAEGKAMKMNVDANLYNVGPLPTPIGGEGKEG